MARGFSNTALDLHARADGHTKIWRQKNGSDRRWRRHEAARSSSKASGEGAVRATVPTKAPSTLYFIAKGTLAAASLQLIGPSP